VERRLTMLSHVLATKLAGFVDRLHTDGGSAQSVVSPGKARRNAQAARLAEKILGSLLLAVALMAAACANRREGAASPDADPELAKRGSIEVTAKLVEIPDGAIFERELYNYATVLKYQVLEVHRGKVKGQTIYVGHYNPFKPRSEAADRRVKDVGGNLKSFRAGQVHHMALEQSMLDSFTGGILNKYSAEDTDPIYWAVWTNLVSD
jgi:hypothetical protein